MLPPESAGFTCLRVPLRDVDEQSDSVAEHLQEVDDFIAQAEEKGGELAGVGLLT